MVNKLSPDSVCVLRGLIQLSFNKGEAFFSPKRIFYMIKLSPFPFCIFVTWNDQVKKPKPLSDWIVQRPHPQGVNELPFRTRTSLLAAQVIPYLLSQQLTSTSVTLHQSQQCPLCFYFERVSISPLFFYFQKMKLLQRKVLQVWITDFSKLSSLSKREGFRFFKN